MATDLSTANVVDTKTGTGWTITVTAANLLSDLSIKDFAVLIDSVIEPNTSFTKTSQTVLTYTGASIPSSTIEVRRITPQNRFQEITFAEKLSSTIFNEEINRIIRKAYEYTLNGIGPGSVATTVTPLNEAYPGAWSGDTVRSRTANRLFEEFEKRPESAQAEAITGVWTALTAADATNNTQIATTAFAHTRVTNALSSSPSLGGNPTSVTATHGDSDTSIATTEFVTELVNPYVEAQGKVVPPTSSASWIVIVLDTELSDLNSVYNAATGRFTVPVNGAGIYDFHLTVFVTNNDASARAISVGLDVNNTGAATKSFGLITLAAATGATYNGSAKLNLSDSDTVDFGITNPATVSLSYGSASSTNILNFIAIQRVGKPLAI